MNTKTQEILAAGNFNLTPRSLSEAMEFSKLISDSSICPVNFKGKPGDVLIAIQMGAEVGLKPIQALQNIAVINGRPSIWGDAAIGLVLASPVCEDIIETSNEDGTIYSCTAIRKGHEPRTYTFSVEEAKQAGLLGKAGTWAQYRKRMLQMRARGFALRDKFADVLKGLILAEEAMDMPPVRQEKFMGNVNGVPASASRTEQLKAKMISSTATVEKEAVTDEKKVTSDAVQTGEINHDFIISQLKSAKTIPELSAAMNLTNKLTNPDEKKNALKIFRDSKAILEQQNATTTNNGSTGDWEKEYDKAKPLADKTE